MPSMYTRAFGVLVNANYDMISPVEKLLHDNARWSYVLFLTPTTMYGFHLKEEITYFKKVSINYDTINGVL